MDLFFLWIFVLAGRLNCATKTVVLPKIQVRA